MSKNIVPAISVIMSVYSEPIEWIKQAIDSILNQTFTGFEFIIVNDNPSRTENRNLLSAYADERIHLISNSENVGLTKSLNFALALAKGKYIARMDADDISLPSRFLKQFEYLEAHPEIGVCGCNVETFGSKRLVWTYPATHQECLLFFRSPFAHPAVMIRHSILKDNHILYDERLRYAQDFDLWERLYPITQFANLQKVLLRYRLSEMQVTHGKAKEQYALSTAIKLRAFNTYCKCHNIEFQLTNPITVHTIKEYKKKMIIDRYSKNRFLYHLYRSLLSQRWRALIYFFLSGDFFRVSVFEMLKVCLSLSVFRKGPVLLSFS